MQPWERETPSQKVSFRKSAKRFVKNAGFAVTCTAAVYIMLTKKIAKDIMN